MQSLRHDAFFITGFRTIKGTKYNNSDFLSTDHHRAEISIYMNVLCKLLPQNNFNSPHAYDTFLWRGKNNPTLSKIVSSDSFPEYTKMVKWFAIPTANLKNLPILKHHWKHILHRSLRLLVDQ